MPFPHLLNRKSFSSEFGELHEFLLNLQQSFLPLAVGNVGLCFVLDSKSIAFVQRLNVRDLRPKRTNLFPKSLKMIHSVEDNASVTADVTP